MKKFKRITIDPQKMGGVPCIRGQRMPVATIVGMIAAGLSKEEILEDHPELEPEDIEQALNFAAQRLKERTVPAAF